MHALTGEKIILRSATDLKHTAICVQIALLVQLMLLLKLTLLFSVFHGGFLLFLSLLGIGISTRSLSPALRLQLLLLARLFGLDASFFRSFLSLFCSLGLGLQLQRLTMGIFNLARLFQGGLQLGLLFSLGLGLSCGLGARFFFLLALVFGKFLFSLPRVILGL